MRIYISIPITGHDLDQVKSRIALAKASIRSKGHTPVSPIDIQPSLDAPYSELLGRDIAALLECDAVVFPYGIGESKGCKLEEHAACLYGKRCYYNLWCIEERQEKNNINQKH